MSKTLRQAIFLRLTLFFIFGIIIQRHWDLTFCWVYVLAFSLLLIGISYFSHLNASYNWRWLFGFGLSLLCLSSAGILTDRQWKASEWRGGDRMQDCWVQVVDDPVKKPKTLMFKVKIENQKAIIFLPIDSISSNLRPSDWLHIRAEFEKVDRMYLRKQGIAARAFVRKNHWEKPEEQPDRKISLRLSALNCRRLLLNKLHEIIPEEQPFSIAAAILFGYVNELDGDLRQTFAATGSSHILAVSGLHFSIIYAILYFLFSFLSKNRKGMIIRQLIVLSLMWLFAFLTGLGPSVVRAAIMLSLWGIGSISLLRTFGINTLCVAAFFMLLYNPFNLFDVGFQLSFAAVLAIMLINPHLVKLHESQNPLIKYLWELSCVSTSAQLGTAPLSIYYFHQFPLIYLVTNIFAIPITALLLCLIPISLLVQFLFGNHSWLFLPVKFFLNFFISGLKNLEAIPNALISGLVIDETTVVCLFLFIILFYLLLVKKRIIYFYLLVILVAS
jgi:competence protein ComEC